MRRFYSNSSDGYLPHAARFEAFRNAASQWIHGRSIAFAESPETREYERGVNKDTLDALIKDRAFRQWIWQLFPSDDERWVLPVMLDRAYEGDSPYAPYRTLEGRGIRPGRLFDDNRPLKHMSDPRHAPFAYREMWLGQVETQLEQIIRTPVPTDADDLRKEGRIVNALANEMDRLMNDWFDKEGIEARSTIDYRDLRFVQERVNHVVGWHQEVAKIHPVLLGTNIKMGEYFPPGVDARLIVMETIQALGESQQVESHEDAERDPQPEPVPSIEPDR